MDETDQRPGFLQLKIGWRGLLTAAGSVTCAATLLGFLGGLSWFLDLWSHFRSQYFMGLILIAVLLWWGKQRMVAIVFLVFAGINFATILPSYLGARALPHDDGPSLRMMLINVNTDLGDVDKVRTVFEGEYPDVLVLQEINDRWVRDLDWLARSHPYAIIRARDDYFGIGLFSRLPLIDPQVVHMGEAGVPSILSTVLVGRAQLRIIATHPMPPMNATLARWQNDQLDQLTRNVDHTIPTILIGDLNLTPWSHQYRKLLRRTGFVDSAKGLGIQPSWPVHVPPLLIPIDHCFHSPNVYVIHRKTSADVGSDHYPVIVDLAIFD